MPWDLNIWVTLPFHVRVHVCTNNKVTKAILSTGMKKYLQGKYLTKLMGIKQ